MATSVVECIKSIEESIQTIISQNIEEILNDFASENDCPIETVRDFMNTNQTLVTLMKKVLEHKPNTSPPPFQMLGGGPVIHTSSMPPMPLQSSMAGASVSVNEVARCCGTVKTSGQRCNTVKSTSKMIDANGNFTGLYLCGRHGSKIAGTETATIKESTTIHPSSHATQMPTRQTTAIPSTSSVGVTNVLPTVQMFPSSTPPKIQTSYFPSPAVPSVPTEMKMPFAFSQPIQQTSVPTYVPTSFSQSTTSALPSAPFPTSFSQSTTSAPPSAPFPTSLAPPTSTAPVVPTSLAPPVFPSGFSFSNGLPSFPSVSTPSQ